MLIHGDTGVDVVIPLLCPVQLGGCHGQPPVYCCRIRPGGGRCVDGKDRGESVGGRRRVGRPALAGQEADQLGEWMDVVFVCLVPSHLFACFLLYTRVVSLDVFDIAYYHMVVSKCLTICSN